VERRLPLPSPQQLHTPIDPFSNSVSSNAFFSALIGRLEAK
jgi:hypothetical protein